jgi:hypothetical protein
VFVSNLSLRSTTGLIHLDCSTKWAPNCAVLANPTIQKENKIMRAKEICYEIEKPEGKQSFRGPRRRWKDNKIMNI